MSNPRFTGLLLLLVGVLVLMGNTMDLLPPEAFFAGLLTYPIGGYLFFMGSRQAINKAEARTARALNRRISNTPGDSHARRQASHVANPNAPRELDAQSLPPGVEPATPDELVLYELDAGDAGDAAEGNETDFSVTSDVSFPVEVQQHDSIADQLQKLSKLREQGIISDEELAIAKAKLLR